MNLNYDVFLDKLNEEVEKLGIDLKEFKLDHVAYQTKTSAEYNLLKNEFEIIATLVREAIVGERRVGIFKFKNPPVYLGQPILVIELIEQKEGQICESGLEHAEYVPSITLEDMLIKYPSINWNTDNINRAEFPMLILRLSDSMQVKFPRKSVLLQ